MMTRLPPPARHAAALDDFRLDATVKGAPPSADGLRLGDVARQGWSVLAGDAPLPLAALRQSRLLANSRWMADFAAMNGLALAPHGKTTMAPRLHALQLRDGAFAITVATAQQLAVARRFGVPRVVLANQPTGAIAVDACFAAIADGIELYCLADSPEGVAALAAGAERARAPAPLHVLVEIGVAGGRTGARGRERAMAVARAIAAAPGLALAGTECFEGILPTTAAVDLLLDDVVALAEACVSDNLIPPRGPIILSAGGSAFFDRVGERFGALAIGGRETLRLLRSGCYLSHDVISYEAAQQRILRETRLKLPPGRLEAALEIWAHVQSRPEPGRAIVTMGKRDISFDAGLPVPQRWFRPGGMSRPRAMPPGHVMLALNDQHGHLGCPGESPLATGDMIAFGIGHPCTTFDKWRLIYVVDDDERIIDAVQTFF